jgi:hypothetical protein
MYVVMVAADKEIPVLREETQFISVPTKQLDVQQSDHILSIYYINIEDLMHSRR